MVRQLPLPEPEDAGVWLVMCTGLWPAQHMIGDSFTTLAAAARHYRRACEVWPDEPAKDAKP